MDMEVYICVQYIHIISIQITYVQALLVYYVYEYTYITVCWYTHTRTYITTRKQLVYGESPGLSQMQADAFVIITIPVQLSSSVHGSFGPTRDLWVSRVTNRLYCNLRCQHLGKGQEVTSFDSSFIEDCGLLAWKRITLHLELFWDCLGHPKLWIHFAGLVQRCWSSELIDGRSMERPPPAFMSHHPGGSSYTTTMSAMSAKGDTSLASTNLSTKKKEKHQHETNIES